jgi:hypothetical protein
MPKIKFYPVKEWIFLIKREGVEWRIGNGE